MTRHQADLALYLHIPYCRQRCSYCDFNAHVVPNDSTAAFGAYAEALQADIEAQNPATISTIFWGGGTPSLMPLTELEAIVSSLHRTFTMAPDLENTIEANPGTVDAQKFEGYLKLGINRVSIGAQSFHPAHLEQVGRIHTASQIDRAVLAARQAGVTNLSLDLIYGFPNQTPDQWNETLERALSLEPDHLSVYQLTVEPSTRLEGQLARGELELPCEDDLIAMDDRAEELLSVSGFDRYEISNWAKTGKECRHNLRYWSDDPYLGLGCGGVSYIDGWRFERIKPPAYYQKAIAQGRSPVVFAERRGIDGALKDYLMMGLRIRDGISSSELVARYEGLTEEALDQFFERLPKEWWVHDRGAYRLTRRGWDFHSEVVMEMMDVMFSI